MSWIPLSKVYATALVLGLLLAGSAQATSVDDLYQASVEVADQSKAERDKGFASALWDVLVKVTGDRSVPSRPELQVLFQRAPSLVQQYSYRLIEREPEQDAPADASPGAGDAAAAAAAADASAAVDLNMDLGIDVAAEAAGPLLAAWLDARRAALL